MLLEIILTVLVLLILMIGVPIIMVLLLNESDEERVKIAMLEHDDPEDFNRWAERYEKSKANKINEGDVVMVKPGARWKVNGRPEVPEFVTKKKWIVRETCDIIDWVVIDDSTDGENHINSPISAKYLTKVKH